MPYAQLDAQMWRLSQVLGGGYSNLLKWSRQLSSDAGSRNNK